MLFAVLLDLSFYCTEMSRAFQRQSNSSYVDSFLRLRFLKLARRPEAFDQICKAVLEFFPGTDLILDSYLNLNTLDSFIE